ncbi:MAG: hypothetical protein QM520_03130 [Gammaproteobacteria bacterium]|nr:hypothetical protein [Gammaproteobacteria bacterium]
MALTEGDSEPRQDCCKDKKDLGNFLTHIVKIWFNKPRLRSRKNASLSVKIQLPSGKNFQLLNANYPL